MRSFPRILAMAALAVTFAACGGGRAIVQHQPAAVERTPQRSADRHPGTKDGGVELPPPTSTNTPKGSGRLLIKYRSVADEKHTTSYKLLGATGWTKWIKVSLNKVKVGAKKTAVTYGLEFRRDGLSFEKPPDARTAEVKSKKQTTVLVYY